MVAIIADEGSFNNGYELYRELTRNEITTEYISLDNVDVKPCINCGGCIYKTYGKCVVRDDGDYIYPKMIQADVLMIVCPITFGSYSFKMKRVIDKLGLIMDRHYYVENGEIVKGGLKNRRFKFFALGIWNNCIDDEIMAFEKLHHENLVITRGVGKSFFVETKLTKDMKDKIIKEVLMYEKDPSN